MLKEILRSLWVNVFIVMSIDSIVFCCEVVNGNILNIFVN